MKQMYCRLLLIYTRCDWSQWMEDRETARMRKYGESKTTRIMMATVPHVTSGLGLRKFQADGFLLTRVYHVVLPYTSRRSWWNLGGAFWSSVQIGIVKGADICLSLPSTLYFAHFLPDLHHQTSTQMLSSNGQLHEDVHTEGRNFVMIVN